MLAPPAEPTAGMAGYPPGAGQAQFTCCVLKASSLASAAVMEAAYQWQAGVGVLRGGRDCGRLYLRAIPMTLWEGGKQLSGGKGQGGCKEHALRPGVQGCLGVPQMLAHQQGLAQPWRSASKAAEPQLKPYM